MASIRKHPNSKFYSACFTNGKGVRTTRSTKCTKPGEALKVAMAYEKAAMPARRKQLTAAQARKVLAELVLDSSGEVMKNYTVRSWLAEFLADKQIGKSKSTATRYEQVYRDFNKFLGARADGPLNAITRVDIREFRDYLRSTGLAPSTVNMTVRKTLSAPFNKAKRENEIDANPCLSIEALPDKEEKNAARKPFSKEQIKLLVSACTDEPEWKGMILFGYTTGLRLRDITSLTWGAIDFKDGQENAAPVLTVVPSKTGNTIEIPLHPMVLAWLKTRARGIGKALIFPTLATKGTGGRFGLSGRFKAIMEKAGIAGSVARAGGKKGRATTTLTFHSLRHSFVSQLMNAGVAEDIRKKLAGHLDSKSHEGYSHAELATLSTAIEKLAL